MFKNKYSLQLIISILLFLVGNSNAVAGNKYGSIAYSPSTKVHGYSYNYNTKSYARHRALVQCKKYSKRNDCKILVNFRNACGALAQGSKGGYGSGWGSTRSLARRYALKSCGRYTTNCRIVRTVCTDR